MVCTVSPSFSFTSLLLLLQNPKRTVSSPCRGSGRGRRSRTPVGNAPCLSPAPRGGYKPSGLTLPSCLSQLARAGRPQETPFPNKPLWGATSPTTRQSAGVWAALSILGARLWLRVPGRPGTACLPGDRKEAMGLTSAVGRVLGGGCWLWRSTGCPRESSGGCGWSGLCSDERAEGSPRLQALPQLVLPWAVTHERTWGSSGFELEGNIESKENYHPPPGSAVGCPWGNHAAHPTWGCVEKGGKRDLQALPNLCFALLGFFPQYVRPTHVRSICRERLQRLASP